MKSITKRIIVINVAVFLTLFLVNEIAVYLYARGEAVKAVEKTLSQRVDAAEELINTSTQMVIRSYLRGIAEKNKEIVSYYYDQYKAGELTQEKARELAKNVLLSQEVGESGYIYCLNSDGIVQVHPLEKLRGAEITKYDFVRNQIRNKEGYLEYDWANPGESDTRQKALYMTYFEPWDWIISVSSYRSEFNSLISVEDLRSALSGKILETGYMLLMDAEGNLLIHPTLEGESIYYTKDADGEFFTQKALEQKDGLIYYDWKEPGENTVRKKFAYVRWIPEMQWQVWATSYDEEVYVGVEKLNMIIIPLIIVIIIAIVVTSMLIGLSISKPIRKTVDLLREIKDGNGDLTINLSENDKTEIGAMARNFNGFKEHIRTIIKEIAENAKNLQSYNVGMQESSGEMIGSVAELNTVSQNIDSASEFVIEHISSVSENVEQAGLNLNSVSSASEEMTATISEIAKNTEHASRETKSAVGKVDSSSARIKELATRADEIGKIIDAINLISEQTKLLALNATIEAASAGEAGKGFAVVANEVKELARQSTESADSINKLIKSVQDSIRLSTSDFEEIRSTIGSVNEIVTGIAAAIEEQSVTTRDIAGNISQASDGLNDVAKRMTQASSSVQEIGKDIKGSSALTAKVKTGTDALQQYIENLTAMSAKMEELTSKFTV